MRSMPACTVQCYEINMYVVDVSFTSCFKMGVIGGPNAYQREGPTPRRAPKGEGHYGFCNLSHL